MPTANRDLRPVLAAYPADCQPDAIEDLAGAGGFSGARFWRLKTPRGDLCLRRWPQEHPTLARLQFIQAVLWHVRQEGFGLVAVPLETSAHAGFVRSDDYFWELTPWLPGVADYWTQPSREKLSAAMMALAQFHRAAATFPLPEAQAASSPGIMKRLAQLRRLIEGDLARIAAAAEPGDWPELHSRARRLLELFPQAQGRVLELMSAAATLPIAIQPCIRDIWHDHVLYGGSHVTGLIDFGAMRADNIAIDVARLLGSLVGDDSVGWATGLQEYSALRPLSESERQLVRAFDASTVLMSGVNWLEWIYVDRRQFDARAAILTRLDENLRRLAHLAEG